jgi:thioredoxin-related protein
MKISYDKLISSSRCYILILLLAVSMAMAFAKVPDGFVTTFADIQKSAKERHVLIYLHFTTDWCGWCRKIESDTYTDPKVKQELSTNFAAASLDCTVPQGEKPSSAVKVNLALYQKFGGDGYPFIVILSEDGNTVFQIIGGYMPVDSFLQQLKSAKKTEKDYLAFQEYAGKADKTSYEYSRIAMRMMTRVLRPDDAIAMAKQILTLDPENSKGDLMEAAWIILQNLKMDKWATDGKQYMDLINKFDADNAKRYLEKMVWVQAISLFENKQFKQVITYLENLIKTAKTLENEQDIKGMLGIAYYDTGNKTKAITTLEAAIKLNPNSSRGKWLQQMLDKFKAK